MAWGTGVQVLTGIKKASTWGTSVAVGATDLGFRAKTFSWSDDIGPLPDPSFYGDAHLRETTNVGNHMYKFSFTVDLKYDGLSTALALALGTAGVPTGSNPYTHLWYPKNDMTGVFFTLGMYDGLKTHEWDSCKFTSLKLSGNAGERIEAEFAGIARRRQENTATNANLSSLTEMSTVTYVKMDAAIATYQTAAIASSLATVDVNDWSISFEREYNTKEAFVSTTAPYMREPMAGEAKWKLSTTLPFEATTYFDAAKAGSLYKWVFGHVVSATATMYVVVPSAICENASAPPSGRNAILQKLDWRCDKAVSAPSGLPTGATALRVPGICVYNATATDALA